MGTPSLQVLLGIYTIFGPLNPMVPLSLRGNFDPEASQQASNSMLQFLLPEGLPHSSSTVGNGRCMPHFSRFSIWSRFVEEERNHAVQVKSTTFAFHFLGRGVHTWIRIRFVSPPKHGNIIWSYIWMANNQIHTHHFDSFWGCLVNNPLPGSIHSPLVDMDPPLAKHRANTPKNTPKDQREPFATHSGKQSSVGLPPIFWT